MFSVVNAYVDSFSNDFIEFTKSKSAQMDEKELKSLDQLQGKILETMMSVGDLTSHTEFLQIYKVYNEVKDKITGLMAGNEVFAGKDISLQDLPVCFYDFNVLLAMARWEIKAYDFQTDVQDLIAEFGRVRDQLPELKVIEGIGSAGVKKCIELYDQLILFINELENKQKYLLKKELSNYFKVDVDKDAVPMKDQRKWDNSREKIKSGKEKLNKFLDASNMIACLSQTFNMVIEKCNALQDETIKIQNSLGVLNVANGKKLDVEHVNIRKYLPYGFIDGWADRGVMPANELLKLIKTLKKLKDEFETSFVPAYRVVRGTRV